MTDIITEADPTTIDPFIARTRIAYFSMEIALRPEIHTYSGGLRHPGTPGPRPISSCRAAKVTCARDRRDTGWALGANGDQPDRHADALYDRLQNTILRLYARNRSRWIWMMKETITKRSSASRIRHANRSRHATSQRR